MPLKKVLTLAAIIAAISSFYIFGLADHFTLDFFLEQREKVSSYQADNPVSAALIFFVSYILITAFSLPAATLVTLLGGAIFGLAEGLLLVSFASTIGASLAFLMARILLQDSVQKRFKNSFEKINKGIEREGAFYLFSLRLVPLFPFVAVNLLMGLTKIPLTRYFWVSQLGMLPGTFVYVNAGTQLAEINSLGQIASPALLIAFAALGLFPLLAKRLVERLRALKVYKGINKPKHFDTNLLVIGAGSAGLVSAYIAAATNAKVSLIEKHRMGGDCLNTGCVPSKALIRSAKMKHYIDNADHYGIEVTASEVDFSATMEHVQKVIQKIEPHDSVERYTDLGVDCIQGEARILDPYRVQVGERIISGKNIVIATGARPFVPPLPGIDLCQVYTSDTIWGLRTKPKAMVVVGEGPIGSELAQSFHRLGVNVTLVGRGELVLPREDLDMRQLVHSRMQQEGLKMKMGYAATSIKANTSKPSMHTLTITKDEEAEEISFDCILFATGRKANVSDFGLEDLDIELNDNGTIRVNEYLQTKYPNIYACGDVAGPYQLTHAASHQAWFVAVNALFGKFWKFKVDYRVIPWATFTDPEIARVGLSEAEAKALNIEYDVHTYGLDDLDRAIADGVDYGKIKVLTPPGSDKVLGACIVGHHAGDLITEFVTAMKHNLGLNKLLGTIHIYPTLAESNKYLAGNWKRSRVSERTMKWLTKYHAWTRK